MEISKNLANNDITDVNIIISAIDVIILFIILLYTHKINKFYFYLFCFIVNTDVSFIGRLSKIKLPTSPVSISGYFSK